MHASLMDRLVQSHSEWSFALTELDPSYTHAQTINKGWAAW